MINSIEDIGTAVSNIHTWSTSMDQNRYYLTEKVMADSLHLNSKIEDHHRIQNELIPSLENLIQQMEQNMERNMRNYVEKILSDMSYRDENNHKQCNAKTWDEKKKKKVTQRMERDARRVTTRIPERTGEL